MAVARPLRHRDFDPGLMEQTELRRRLTARRLKRRHLALVLVAIVAGVMASISLVLDLPDTLPPRPSYLPPDLPTR
jgi:hypothetical protein